MYDILANAIYNIAMGVTGFSFPGLWAYEPKKPACLIDRTN